VFSGINNVRLFSCAVLLLDGIAPEGTSHHTMMFLLASLKSGHETETGASFSSRTAKEQVASNPIPLIDAGSTLDSLTTCLVT
jgi:hypothetical protein